MLTADLKQTRLFLETLGGNAFTFQILPEKKGTKVIAAHRHGCLDEHADWLTAQNQAGAGVFVMVNEGDGKGRKQGQRHPRSRRFRRPGRRTVGTRPGGAASARPRRGKQPRISGTRIGVSGTAPLGDFSALQAALAAKFGGDPARQGSSPGHAAARLLPPEARPVHDADRTHQKSRRPIMKSKQQTTSPGTGHSLNDFVQAMGLEIKLSTSRPAGSAASQSASSPTSAANDAHIPEGSRNGALMSLAGTMRRAGMEETAILAALLEHNQTHCNPPLEIRRSRPSRGASLAIRRSHARRRRAALPTPATQNVSRENGATRCATCRSGERGSSGTARAGFVTRRTR